MSSEHKPWRRKNSKEIYANRYFHLRVDECELGDGRVMPHYFVLDFPDWVHVVALNKSGQLIVVHQYRYPGEGWFFEFPGGSTHPDRKEQPLAAAKRELLEETGFSSDEWSDLGFYFPNPALMSNRCHVFLAQNCVRTAATSLDPYEVLEVQELPVVEFEAQFFKSNKLHGMMLGTYQMYQNFISKK